MQLPPRPLTTLVGAAQPLCPRSRHIKPTMHFPHKEMLAETPVTRATGTSGALVTYPITVLNTRRVSGKAEMELYFKEIVEQMQSLQVDWGMLIFPKVPYLSLPC